MRGSPGLHTGGGAVEEEGEGHEQGAEDERQHRHARAPPPLERRRQQRLRLHGRLLLGFPAPATSPLIIALQATELLRMLAEFEEAVALRCVATGFALIAAGPAAQCGLLSPVTELDAGRLVTSTSCARAGYVKGRAYPSATRGANFFFKYNVHLPFILESK